MTDEDINTQLFELVARSEERIDRTNEMICGLSKIMEHCSHMCDTLLSGRNDLKEEIQEANSLMSEAQKDYHERLDSLTEELHSMKADYQKELHKLRQDYRKLTAAYNRLVENSHGAKAEVNINNA